MGPNAAGSSDKSKPPLRRAVDYVKGHANFFRIHLTAFILIPFLCGTILFACNGRYRVDYLDSLFIAYSAFSGCGLSTVNLSQLTAWQQVILLLLMVGGHFGVVSTFMVLVRKHYFQTRCQHFVKVTRGRSLRRFMTSFSTASTTAVVPTSTSEPVVNGSGVRDPLASATNGRPRPAMRALTTGASPINKAPPTALAPLPPLPSTMRRGSLPAVSTAAPHPFPKRVQDLQSPGLNLPVHRDAEPQVPVADHSPPVTPSHEAHHVRFAPAPDGEQHDGAAPVINVNGTLFHSTGATLTASPTSIQSPLPATPSMENVIETDLRQRRHPQPTPLRRATIVHPRSQMPAHYHQRGGFPTLSLVKRLFYRLFPKTYTTLHRKFTLPSTPVIVARPNIHTKGQQEGDHEKGNSWTDDIEKMFSNVQHRLERWVPFDGLKVSRNSNFDYDDLTEEQLEKIGGIEYRALRLLSYLVPLYMLGVHAFCFILIAPYLASTSRYDSVFTSQVRVVPKAWFALFQVVGAFTGGGMSLSDLGMVPFQRATLMIFSLGFAILAGNHAFPIFLRLTIWILTKFEKENSPRDKTLHFLLDHPRRCFIYLFPCQQTWFLVVVLVVLSVLEWAAFLVLDIGLPVTESLPPGARVLAGLFQGLAARAAGFAIVNIGALAPAVIFLYIVMMYIAVFPVAMSIRSTNVYEEKSLGIYEKEESDEPTLDAETKDREAVGKYLNWHLRRQLAFDLWWLIVGVWLVCIIERDKLMDDDNAPWFNLFRVVFELVSAYGGVGLSLGIPTENFSFIGACRPLSKVVVIFVMVRGRHRGLPMAVDRSILLPEEFSNDLHARTGGRPVTRAYTLPADAGW
ncbi:TrkH-domain-containing protein [Exidia glandulosa HHB12029]|uniref:TrkH-domain-containing protein n=1 Tax=Exidia glandulosa HHB12029 TaxID=1314781 RepID=A0A166AEA1_EXIGL|nr:TrkH-domain-containing protein [Exidia glandulosa HHB12029]